MPNFRHRRPFRRRNPASGKQDVPMNIMVTIPQGLVAVVVVVVVVAVVVAAGFIVYSTLENNCTLSFCCVLSSKFFQSIIQNLSSSHIAFFSCLAHRLQYCGNCESRRSNNVDKILKPGCVRCHFPHVGWYGALISRVRVRRS